MLRLLRLRAPLALAGALALGACVQTPARTDAAIAEPNLEFVRTPTWATGLRWATPRTSAATATATIGANGGELELASTGLVLTVPAGAVSSPTKFTVTALPGALVAYDFQPHESAFAKAIVVEQRLRGVEPVAAGVTFEGGSFGDVSQLDQAAGVAQVSELVPASRLAHAVRAEVRHFSGWLLTIARR